MIVTTGYEEFKKKTTDTKDSGDRRRGGEKANFFLSALPVSPVLNFCLCVT
jgi:hypothetical protein